MLDDQDEFEKFTPAQLAVIRMHELLHAATKARQALTVALTDVYTNLIVPHREAREQHGEL